MRIPVEKESRDLPVSTYLKGLQFKPRLKSIRYGVKPTSVYKYSLGQDSKCNQCGSKVSSTTANRTVGYSLAWDCQECGYILMYQYNKHYQLWNNPVKWYVKLWWQFKVGVRRFFK